jgi:hypothetical protein
MMHAAATLVAVETARQLHRTAHMKIENVMAVLRGFELSHWARDTEHVEMARRTRAHWHPRWRLGQHAEDYSAKPRGRQLQKIISLCARASNGSGIVAA